MNKEINAKLDAIRAAFTAEEAEKKGLDALGEALEKAGIDIDTESAEEFGAAVESLINDQAIEPEHRSAIATAWNALVGPRV